MIHNRLTFLSGMTFDSSRQSAALREGIKVGSDCRGTARCEDLWAGDGKFTFGGKIDYRSLLLSIHMAPLFPIPRWFLKLCTV